MKGDSTSQEAPIAHQRSGLLWRSLASSGCHRHLRRYSLPLPLVQDFCFQARRACPRQLFGAPAAPNRFGSALRPHSSTSIFHHVNIMCLTLFSAPPGTPQPRDAFPWYAPDPKEPILRKQSVVLAAVALVVSVGMASAQQPTPQQYDRSAVAPDLQSKTPDRPSTATPLDQGNGNWDPPPVAGPTTQR